MTSEDFVAFLNETLTERGWTQSELARRAGISNQMVSGVITGQINPGLRFFKGVAKALGMPEAELMQRAGWAERTGPILPAVAEFNRVLLSLDEQQRGVAIRAMRATLEAIVAVTKTVGATV